MPTYLVTGAAGFIGFHLVHRLLERGEEVVGVDNLNDYYDVKLKLDRLKQLEKRPGFRFVKLDIADRTGLPALFRKVRPQRVVNLAAQAGVRYSLTNPHAYVDSSLVGFVNILEACRHGEVEHLVYASSSSVYGANTRMPFSVHDNVDHPISLYAATKKANELMAHTYSHLYRLPTTGLRFFTVYGPWGRPDMAYFSFTKAIEEGRPIELFNEGRMKRDFTYVDDIIEGVVRVAGHVATPNPAWDSANPDPASSNAPYRLYNIGNSTPIALREFIAALEKCLGKKAELRLRPMQPGDVEGTFADVADLTRDIGFRPATSIEDGLARFVEWYRAYYSRKAVTWSRPRRKRQYRPAA
jgi:UDP-glucuronate 4-epimerase